MFNVQYGIFPTVPSGFDKNPNTGNIQFNFLYDVLLNTAVDFGVERYISKTKRPELQFNLPNLCLVGMTHALEITSSKISVELLNKILKQYNRDLYSDLKSPQNAWSAYAASLAGGAAIYTIGMYPLNIIKQNKYPEERTSKSFSKALSINTTYGATFGAVLGYFSPILAKEAALCGPNKFQPKILLKSVGVFAASFCAGSAITAPLRGLLYRKGVFKSIQESFTAPVISSF
ncbi:hypothetical protein M9Y10_023523 [Tritrichomonas musculus]|uniref:Uncharacterized protein n=1 Tax=Tritrichomonas musculus TaxID=1915356 RepID=A0ABR2KWF4_9EUKA